MSNHVKVCQDDVKVCTGPDMFDVGNRYPTLTGIALEESRNLPARYGGLRRPKSHHSVGDPLGPGHRGYGPFGGAPSHHSALENWESILRLRWALLGGRSGVVWESLWRALLLR